MAVGDVWEMIPRLWDGVQLSINALNYVVTSEAGGGATPNAVAQAFDTLVAASYKAISANTATYVGATAQKVHPGGVGLRGQYTGSAGAGTGGAVCAPTAVAGLLQKHTAQPGRSGFGHAYVGFVPVVNVTGDGKPNAAYQTLLLALASQLSAGLAAASGGGTVVFAPCIYSRKLNAAYQITGFFPTLNFATQRRRSAYGRPNPTPI